MTAQCAGAESGDDCCLGVLERDRSLGEVGYDRIVARMGDAKKAPTEAEARAPVEKAVRKLLGWDDAA